MDSIQFFPPPYRDESTSNEHCRACLVKVDTDCVSIHEIYPWNETEMISIQGIIEFLINRKVSIINVESSLNFDINHESS